jgi:hypothetical protein
MLEVVKKVDQQFFMRIWCQPSTTINKKKKVT